MIQKRKSRNKKKSSFWRIQYIQNEIITNSREYYIPDKFLTIDESMIKYDGNHKDK